MMSSMQSGESAISLLAVTRQIKQAVTIEFSQPIWITAELNKLNHHPASGHFFPELVEKRDGKVVAKVKATIWKSNFSRINTRFEQVLKHPLKEGIKVLLLGQIEYHPLHDLKINITNIDPSYTLGDLEREKQETIKKLGDEGLLLKNRELRFPLLPKRVAIISAETSRGYEDFVHVLQNNQWKYGFNHSLFPAYVQGEKAVTSICEQLRKIRTLSDDFDVVAIIRGGGADVDFACYNNYQLSKAIASFPLPVITGIGHTVNTSVVETVAFENSITPTKLAEFLIQKFHDFADPVRKAREVIQNIPRTLIEDQKRALQSYAQSFRLITESRLANSGGMIRRQIESVKQHSRFLLKQRAGGLAIYAPKISHGAHTLCHTAEREIGTNAHYIKRDVTARLGRCRVFCDQNVEKLTKGVEIVLALKRREASLLKTSVLDLSVLFIKNEQTELDNAEKNIRNMSPVNVLKRGYSITRVDGTAIRSQKQVEEGDNLSTTVLSGTIHSIVTSPEEPTS